MDKSADFLKPYGAIPTKTQMKHYKIEKKAFFHFGINTFTDAEWGLGTESEKAFNPTDCDCRQWIREIKKAGFKLAIITAKHHDGFCLWQSELTSHTIKNSPYKNGNGDIIKEFTDACKEFDIKAGIYISPWDRNSPYWGTNDYSLFFAKQLRELLTNYGKIDEIWWDGAGSKDTPYDWGLWAYTVKSLQPECAIYGSQGAAPYADLRWIGNEGGINGEYCFATIDYRSIETEDTEKLNFGIADGEKFAIAEVDTSIRPGWFFHKEQENEVKSPEQLVKLWFSSVGANSNMLLNFPPDRSGRIRKKDANSAIAAHGVISKALSFNLASEAEIICGSECYEGYEAENLIVPCDSAFFAPKGNTATVILKFKAPVKFNMFEISEVIELGHRVRDFKIEALDKKTNAWKTLFNGKSIGYKWAEYFDEIEANEVRFTVYASDAVPLIRNFGLYRLDPSVFKAENAIKKGIDLTKRKNAKINYNDNTAEVEFGGIYPFNTVKFNGTGIWSYKIEAFNGSDYILAFKGSNPSDKQIVTLPRTVETSYKMRLVSAGKIAPEVLNIEVYNI